MSRRIEIDEQRSCGGTPVTLEEYEIWKIEQEKKRLAEKNKPRENLGIINVYLSGEHKVIEL